MSKQHEEHVAHDTVADDATDTTQRPKGYTPPKGKPTPKRDRPHRGNTTPPMTRAEAKQRKKELKASMSKEEYKTLQRKEREEASAERRRVQEAMARGDERYLLERDKGPVRAYLRDWVDARRFLANFLMPAALALLVLMLIANSNPNVAGPISMFTMALMLAFLIEGVILGRRAVKAARAKFGDLDAGGFTLGYYAYSRANQPRRWRTPMPRVEIGDKV
ncbi:DUF3043 domain-containing protein [Corynebacterium argentoratense]